MPQDHLEPVLLGHLRGLDGAEVRFGTELTAFDQDGGGVTVPLRERAGGAEEAVRAGWLVGADGAHSRVRTGLGIAMDGPGHLAEQLTVLFEAPLATVVTAATASTSSSTLRRAACSCPTAPATAGCTAGPGTRGTSGWRATPTPASPASSGPPPASVTCRSGSWKLAWVRSGWAGPGLLDTYEAEWRPVGARRAARSALQEWEPPGPEALAEDLNGRLGHAWLAQANGHRRSTLDLLGPGLTLLAGPGTRAWADAGATVDTAFPLDVRPVDPGAAATLSVHPDGAVLVRPDARVIAHWPTAPPDPRAELAAAIRGWVEGALVM